MSAGTYPSSATHPSSATPHSYFLRSPCEWRFSDFCDHHRLSQVDAGPLWENRLQSIITNTDVWGDQCHKKAQNLLDQHQAQQYFHQDVRSFLLDAWVRGLRGTLDNDQMAQSERATIQRLLNRYNGNGIDKDTANNILNSLSQNPSPSQATVIVNGKVNTIKSYTTTNINSNKRSRNSASSETGTRAKRREAPAYHHQRHLKEFKRTWTGLVNEAKWPLPALPGDPPNTQPAFRYVEDVVYDRFKDSALELPVHSWVIDTSDPLVMGLFSDEARRMITEEIPPLPPLEDWFLDAMVRYSGHNNAVQLKDYIYTTPPLTDSTPLEERAGRIWLDNTMRCWSTLLDNPATFTRNHGEVWLTSNLWTALYDQCMGTVPGTYIHRGESKSMSTSDRKNSNVVGRRRVGHLYDSVTLLDDHEIGAAEHSKVFVSDSSKKWTGDTLKVIKVLHDMLYRLQKTVTPLRGTGKLQVQGAVMAGWNSQHRRMALGNGYMCVMAVDQTRKVPSSYDHVDDILLYLKDVWVLRNVLMDCKKSINAGGSRTAAELRAYLSATTATIERPGIPRSIETDPDDTSGCDERKDD